jgi:hypothetical protein
MKNFGLMALLVVAVLSVHAQEGEKAKKEKAVGDPCVITVCPVSNQKMGSMGQPVLVEYNGREVRLCCKGCVKSFEAKPEETLQKVDQQLIEDQKPHYPLDTCIVSGEKLGEGSEPVDYIFNNRLFRLCCEGCTAKISADPKPFFKKLDQAVIEKQKEAYPLKTCVVSGQELGSMGDPYDVVIANRLLRLCCKGCEAKVKKDPSAFLSKLTETNES